MPNRPLLRKGSNQKMLIERLLIFIDAVNEWTGRIIAYLALFMMFTIVYEVFMRYVFNMPTIWVLEVNQYVLCAYAALAGGYTMLHKGHVNVEILYEKFSPKRKALINICSSVCFYAVVLILLWKSGFIAWEAWETQESSYSMLDAPLWPAKMAIPVGAFLLLLQGTANLIRDLIFLLTGKELKSSIETA